MSRGRSAAAGSLRSAATVGVDRAGRRDRGFTLVEVVIAIVLVGILSSVVVVGVGQLTSRGSTASCAASQDAARAAATVHLGSTGSYPTTFGQMTGGSSPSLTLPSGANLSASGDAVTGGGWTLRMAPGSGSAAPTFTCLEGNLWTPAALGASAIWVDAQATGSVVVNGSAVAQWNDLSGNGRHLTQPNAAIRPALEATGLNGRPAVRFTQDALVNTSVLVTGSQLAVYAVATMEATSDANARLVSLRNASQALEYDNTSSAVPIWRNVTMISNYVNNNGASVAAANATPYVISSLYRPNMSLHLNGGVPATAIAGAGMNLDTTAGLFVGQANQSVDNNWDGLLGELLITTDTTEATRQRVEGYLAHRWGMAANLPANHPYRNAPPTL